MSKAEYHVASYIVHAATDQHPAARDALLALPGVEIHAEEQSRLIVTAEAGHVKELADLCDAMQNIEGVMSVAPVYHEFTEDQEAG